MNSKTIARLLSTNYSQYSTQFELDDYIRKLRDSLRTQFIQNQVLLEETDYIKELKDQSILVQDTEKLFEHDVEFQQGTPFEITATIDPNRFKTISIIPDYYQIKYFKKIFSKLIIDNELTNLYGAFEKQKNGNIHFHGITYIYNNNEQSISIEKLIASHLTDKQYRPNARFKNTQCKPVKDVLKWFAYMNKESDNFIEYNIKKKSLDL
jgi:hypothetical protein